MWITFNVLFCITPRLSFFFANKKWASFSIWIQFYSHQLDWIPQKNGLSEYNLFWREAVGHCFRVKVITFITILQHLNVLLAIIHWLSHCIQWPWCQRCAWKLHYSSQNVPQCYRALLDTLRELQLLGISALYIFLSLMFWSRCFVWYFFSGTFILSDIISYI